MKKFGDHFLLAASLILTAITAVCAANIIIGLIKSASPDSQDAYYFFMQIANIYLSIAIAINGIFSIACSGVLLHRRVFKTVSIVSICLCIISFICVLAFFLM